jgi:hypothetical protein
MEDRIEIGWSRSSKFGEGQSMMLSIGAVALQKRRRVKPARVQPRLERGTAASTECF